MVEWTFSAGTEISRFIKYIHIFVLKASCFKPYVFEWCDDYMMTEFWTLLFYINLLEFIQNKMRHKHVVWVFIWIWFRLHRQQELSNLLHEKKYLKALGIAISLDQPHTALRVIRGTLSLISLRKESTCLLNFPNAFV